MKKMRKDERVGDCQIRNCGAKGVPVRLVNLRNKYRGESEAPKAWCCRWCRGHDE